MPHSSSTPRRGFLGRLVGSAAALVGAGLATPRGAGASPAPTPIASDWDMSWVDKITSAHRQVFDAPDMVEGMVLRNARTWMRGYADVYGTKDGDVNAVVVIRHIAVPMVMQDELWAAMEYGKQYKLADPTTGAPATRNPFINLEPDDSHATIYPDGGLDTLMSRGVIVLACNLALDRAAGELATKTRVSREDARRRLFAHLVPGVTVVPSGIFGIARAQEAGCHYLRAT